MLLLIIFILSNLIILGYNITHKNIEIIVINIMLLLILIGVKLIGFTLGVNYYYVIGTIFALIIQIAMGICIIKEIVKFIKNKPITKSEMIGITLMIIFFFIYLIVISNTYSEPAFETELEKEEYIYSKMKVDMIIKILCELPIINIFVMTMLENKEKKGV